MRPKISDTDKPSKELQALSAMLREDIQDAVDHGIPAAQIVVTLLIYAAHTSIEHDVLEAQEYIEYAASSWNQTAQALDGEPWLLKIYDEGDGPTN